MNTGGHFGPKAKEAHKPSCLNPCSIKKREMTTHAINCRVCNHETTVELCRPMYVNLSNSRNNCPICDECLGLNPIYTTCGHLHCASCWETYVHDVHPVFYYSDAEDEEEDNAPSPPPPRRQDDAPSPSPAPRRALEFTTPPPRRQDGTPPPVSRRALEFTPPLPLDDNHGGTPNARAQVDVPYLPVLLLPIVLPPLPQVQDRTCPWDQDLTNYTLPCGEQEFYNFSLRGMRCSWGCGNAASSWVRKIGTTDEWRACCAAPVIDDD